ncbi:MAG: LacI family DNA-binding transcriptional regulator [Actinomycetota bacterium]|nr:LacI family DNA-binding transcriptional regulator [Actinomycetota bacterium]
MAILKDIAEKAGVSVSTASRALQNDPRISVNTKNKVTEVASLLGYAKHKNKNIPNKNWDSAGLIVPEVISGYYAQLVHYANDNFAKNELLTVIKITNFKKDTMIRHIKSFAKNQVRCLIIIVDDSEELSDDVFSAVSLIKVPIMFITSKYISKLDYDNLYVDEHRGITMGLEHLIQKGYKQIGFIGEDQTLGRYHVYNKVMQSFGMHINKDFIKISKKRAEEGGYYCMKEILKQNRYPDAIFASYDSMAIGAIHAIEEASLRIPEDIAILGFDDILISKYISRGLTTIKNPCKDMISIATRVLLKRIEQPNLTPQQIALKPLLVVRGTT